MITENLMNPKEKINLRNLLRNQRRITYGNQAKDERSDMSWRKRYICPLWGSPVVWTTCPSLCTPFFAQWLFLGWAYDSWPGRSGFLLSDCGKRYVWMGVRTTMTLNAAGNYPETTQETNLETKATRGGAQSQGWELGLFLTWRENSQWILQKQNQYTWFIF